MNLTLNGFTFDLSVHAFMHGHWFKLPANEVGHQLSFNHKGIEGVLTLMPDKDRIEYELKFKSTFNTRLRLRGELQGQSNLFHLIPGNIHGDNNAPHVRPNEFPVLANDRLSEKNRSPFWEFRADRASHPVSILCCDAGAVGISIDPYSDCPAADDGFIRNGVFSALPNAFGVSLGYGNDPLSFHNKTVFNAATADLSRGATARGTIFAVPGNRRSAHQIIRALHAQHRDVPKFKRTYNDALRALSQSFIEVNWSEKLQQYSNRKCSVPVDRELQPWRVIFEIGWTGGSMMAYPFMLAERLYPDIRFPKSPAKMLEQICSGFNEATGLIRDACVNRFTNGIPDGWNKSDINGWWSGERVPLTRDNHCAYTNAHAAYYLLEMVIKVDASVAQAFLPVSLDSRGGPTDARNTDKNVCATDAWESTALKILDTVISMQREDGAFGYIFSGKEKKVLDYEGFAGCWFVPALALAWKLTGEKKYLTEAEKGIAFYAPFVANLAAWGTPMDTCKSIDSEGNLAFIRAAKLMHEFTEDKKYLDMLIDGANYEYLWRYCFRSRPQAPPLRNSSWNSCGGSITSVSNPHIHPMSVVVTHDLEYLARITGDNYHQQRADDGMAWLMNTMELYPEVTGYGRYGVLSERTCPSDGLLEEKFWDDGSPSSTWWSYNAWAAASAMEAIAEQIVRGRPEPTV